MHVHLIRTTKQSSSMLCTVSSGFAPSLRVLPATDCKQETWVTFASFSWLNGNVLNLNLALYLIGIDGLTLSNWKKSITSKRLVMHVHNVKPNWKRDCDLISSAIVLFLIWYTLNSVLHPNNTKKGVWAHNLSMLWLLIAFDLIFTFCFD